ncbi:hypothetical protein Plhal304r1_c082g0167331 [Plasmopara halstedii]
MDVFIILYQACSQQRTHPINMEIIVAESNIVEEISPQVSTPVVAEVVDTPAPSLIKPVEASNIEVSKVSQLDEPIVAPAVTENVVNGEEYNPELKILYNSDDEYDTDNEDEFISTMTKLASPIHARPVTRVEEIRDDSWMYESSSDDSCSDDGSIVREEPNNEPGRGILRRI